MTTRIPSRPDLVGTVPRQLQTTRPRVLQSEDAATVEAQRVTQAIALRTNEAIGRVNNIIGTPYGEGEVLTQPVGNGQRTELLTLAAGANVIPHTLGRPAQGFATCDFRATLAAGTAPQYAEFYTVLPQAAPAINTAAPIDWQTKALGTAPITCPGTPGVPDPNITIGQAGTYAVQVRTHTYQLLTGPFHLYLWLHLNGADIAGSMTAWPTIFTGQPHCVHCGWFLTVAAGDVLQIRFAVDDLALNLDQTIFLGIPSYAASVQLENVDNGGAGPALVHVERSRSEDERSIRLDASTACTAKIWVW